MTKPQLGKLKRSIKQKTSKTDVAIAVLAKYLDRLDRFPLRERMTTIQSRLAQVEVQL